MELKSNLTKKEDRFFRQRYKITNRGNFEGRNVLQVARSITDIAQQEGISVNKVHTILQQAKHKLYTVRQTRKRPLLDDKILTAWNGLMISSLARAGFYLKRPEYVKSAEKAADFILQNMVISKQLYRSHAQGQTNHVGYIEDHAFLIHGLIDLFEATAKVKWLKAAMDLDLAVRDDYEDSKGGWYRTHKEYADLLVREVPTYDGAEPSGSSYMLLNLLRMSALTTSDSYRLRAQKAFVTYGKILEKHPLSLDDMLIATHWKNHPPQEVYIVASSREEADSMLNSYRNSKPMNRVLVVSTNENRSALEDLLPPLKGKKAIDQMPTGYVCLNGMCKQPTINTAEFLQQLNNQK